tara:strand:- start:2736 stop:2939 length:204 start_codon:yes stop_codon:yes gene_type:complete
MGHFFVCAWNGQKKLWDVFSDWESTKPLVSAALLRGNLCRAARDGCCEVYADDYEVTDNVLTFISWS